MSDSEDDYMSDKILGQIVDTRPGLARTKAAKERERTEKIKQKNEASKKQQVPKRVLEMQKRDEGLKTELGASNKGFAMLAKMGYKPGMAIGKSGTGRTAPVEVELKSCRSGVGMKQERERVKTQRQQVRAHQLVQRREHHARVQQDFRQRLQEQQGNRATERDLYKAQKACEQLDSQQSITTPAERFFWPPDRLAQLDELRRQRERDERLARDEPALPSDEEEEEEEEEDRFQTHEKLEIVTTCLRSRYFYCIWCGTKYHGQYLYLGSRYFYCIWCGTKYHDQDDLASHCPGNTEADHDDL